MTSVSLVGHPLQVHLKDGNLQRVSDTMADGYAPVHKDARSALIVPMKYRGSVNGVLIIESLQAEAFSQYDEHLMVVITNHLAGLIEYIRSLAD